MKKCVNCNNIIKDDDKYCRNCGCVVTKNWYYTLLNLITAVIEISLVIVILLFIASCFLY